MMYCIAGVCVLALANWAWSLYAVVQTLRGVPKLSRDASPPPETWPRVSLIVPARDEARELETAIRSRLADDYPALQVVIVDDRSTDETGAIADRLAREDPRVSVVHITDLPEGWLGKLYAMHRGISAADGAWLLFSDADVRFAPGTLRRAVARCEHDRRDHLAVMPGFTNHGVGVDAAMDMFCHTLVSVGRPWKAQDPQSRVAAGGGLFNLVRRSAYDRTPGFAWLKLEIGDDVALAQMLKQHGARTLVMDAVDCVSLDFYRDLGEMAYGLEKSGFAVIGRFSYLVTVGVCVVGWLMYVGFLAGLAHPAGWVRAVTAATLVLAWLSQGLLARWLGRRLLPALLFPFGAMALQWMILRSAWLAYRRGGVAWRGTVYPVDLLRAGARLQLR